MDDKFIITGGKKLTGTTQVSGAKNVALKALVAACLTTDEIIIENIPLISDLFTMVDIIKELGGSVKKEDHKLIVNLPNFLKTKIDLENGAEIRTSALFMSPLLARMGEAVIPNPGGCRIGARPIDRTVEGLQAMGVEIEYRSSDGFFYMKAPNGLKGADYTFKKSTHTGTETLLMAAVLAKGVTTLRNAAQEPEIDELISFLSKMGAQIVKRDERTIEITGVGRLHGATLKIGPDRNEAVTLAIAAIITKGDVFIENIKKTDIFEFVKKLEEIGGGVEVRDDGIRFFYKGEISSTNIETSAYPGFMTDWQAPWAVLMTQATGASIIHERVYESRFSYVWELQKMGAEIELFNPVVENPEEYYNFNIEDDKKGNKHAAKITGPTELHNGVVTITDLRAGATLVLAALAAKGESVIKEVHHLDRGYEKFEDRLNNLGAEVIRESDE